MGPVGVQVVTFGQELRVLPMHADVVSLPGMGHQIL